MDNISPSSKFGGATKPIIDTVVIAIKSNLFICSLIFLLFLVSNFLKNIIPKIKNIMFT